MAISFYRWKETDQAVKNRILRRAQADIDSVIVKIKDITDDVRDRGDDALIDCAQKFENSKIKSIKACEEEFELADRALDDDLKAAIQKCINNVRIFHEEQMQRIEQRWMVEIEPGVWAGEQVKPIDSVGLYVPRGKGAFPSALYMLAIPATIAGVPDIAIVSPPTEDGGIDDATLFTAKLCGVRNVYKCGGAQAIAALAYGTQTVPRVRKVLGPGSPYVAAAKKYLSHILDPGMPAGPSESIILADETVDPDNTILDILNEAEHGKDSAALLVTHDENLAMYVHEKMPAVISSLPSPHREICDHVMGDYGGIILTETLEESISFANEYAPEHLHLKVADAENVIDKINNAGEILIGEYTPCSLGNYGIGINHVLPTGGWAHTYSCTSVWDFLKITSISRCDKTGFISLKETVQTMTDYEGFPVHGEVLRRRNI